MHPQLTRFSGSSLRLLLSVIYLLLTLFLAGCGSLDASSSTHNSTPTTSTTGNTTPTTADQTATDTSNITPSTVTFAAGTTSRIVTSIWSLSANQGNGSVYWVALKTLSPEVLTTPQITYHHTCQRRVQSISVTVSPTLGCNSVTKTFTFSAAVNMSPGPSNVMLTSTWKRSDGTSGTTTTGIVPQSTTTVTLSDSWSLTAPITKGTYWEELSVTAPNSVTSNQTTFDITSC